jgi:hypothetical protein
MIWVAIASGFVFGVPALWMLSRGLWPDAFAKRCVAARKSIGVTLLLGLVPAIIAGLVITLLGKRLGPVPGIFVTGAVVVWGIMGVTGIASLIGERLWPTGEPWRQTRNGGLVVICAALIPVVGWFLVLPMMAVIGMGINVRCLFTGTPKSVVADVPPPLPSAN